MSRLLKSIKIGLRILAGLLLLCILTAVFILLWYYPHYCANRQPIQIAVENPAEIKMMSCNVRCLSPLDTGKRSWFYRADLIMDDIAEQAPGIIGFQEATKWQYTYLVDCMPAYDSVITYRDETLMSEGCPIFYHRELYTLVNKGSFWLSETPDVMSKDWGAAHYRICSYVILTDHATGKDFVVFNTHLDHVSDQARIKGIQVVLNKIAEFGGLPAVIMGDLNATEFSDTYISLTEHFADARYEATETSASPTYQGWGETPYCKRIDYFMVSRSGICVQTYSVLAETHNGVYASDHWPIVMTMTLT